jgi:hypothetical protein
MAHGLQRGHDNRLETLAGFLLEQNQLPCLLVWEVVFIQAADVGLI